MLVPTLRGALARLPGPRAGAAGGADDRSRGLSPDPAELRAGVGIDALELFVEVLSASAEGPQASEQFYGRLCDAVCRLAEMRCAVIFSCDTVRQRVRT